MNPRQERFIEEYLKDLNATQAAIRAGYSEKTARSQGNRLLTNVDILEKISERRNKILEDIRADCYENVINLQRCARLDPREFFDENGNLKSIHDIEPESRIGIQSFEVVKRKRSNSEGETEEFVEVIKIKMVDKLRSIELLGKYQGIFNNKFDVSFPNGCGSVREGGDTDMTIYFPKKVPVGAPVSYLDDEKEVTVEK
ncbi:terminase small subunit [Candidatus Latescibacterota bacterium]